MVFGTFINCKSIFFSRSCRFDLSLSFWSFNYTPLNPMCSGQIQNIQVAWIKADAKAILAIHEHVITNNDRLSVTHNDFNTWTLTIRNVKMEDRGEYMCQVNTDPMKMQVKFQYFNIHFNSI